MSDSTTGPTPTIPAPPKAGVAKAAAKDDIFVPRLNKKYISSEGDMAPGEVVQRVNKKYTREHELDGTTKPSMEIHE